MQRAESILSSWIDHPTNRTRAVFGGIVGAIALRAAYCATSKYSKPIQSPHPTQTADRRLIPCLPDRTLHESSASNEEKNTLFFAATENITSNYIKANPELFVMKDTTWTKNGDVFCGKTTSREPYPHATPILSHTVYKNGDTALSISLNGEQSAITLAIHNGETKQTPKNFTYDEALKQTQEIFGNVLVQYPYTDATAPYEFGVHAPSGAIQTVIFNPQGIIQEKPTDPRH